MRAHFPHTDIYHLALVGDLRSGAVLGMETTHPFRGGYRRHDQSMKKGSGGLPLVGVIEGI